MISSKEILDKTGISRATLNNYIKMGIIPRPVVKRPDETLKNIKSLGYFSRTVLDRIERVKKLKKEGKSMEVISEMIKDEEKDVRGQGEISFEDRNHYKKTGVKNGPEKEIHEGELKLTLEGIRFPAYLINFDFRVIWINPEAEKRILHQEVRNIGDEDSKNIFKLIFNWEFHCHVKNWKDLVAYHMSFAKLKFNKTWIPRLYKGISGNEAGVLEKVYDETSISPDCFIRDTEINFLKNDGSTDKFRIYSMLFKEGILFVYVPSG
ncbi:MerR family transcriptional regulator [Deltaproteobacteria bacterium]|nr:MerR family transcriptional regulator [Deltaproteobacteria bacterium]